METTIISLLVLLVGSILIWAISKRKGTDVRHAPIPMRYWLPIIIIIIVILSSLGVIAYFHDKNWEPPTLETSSVEGVLETGKTYPIQWQPTGIDKVNISMVNYDCLDRNSTTSVENIFLPSEIAKTEVCYGKIVDDFSAKDKIYNWSIPSDLFSTYPAWQSGDNFKIIITGFNKKGQIEDTKQSPDYFKIVALGKETEKPYIKVLSPNGGERWVNGQTYDIAWESQGIDKVFITIIDYNIEETCRLTYDVENYVSAEKGKYLWTVGSGRCSISPGDKFKIEIQEPEGTSSLRAKDTSDNYFIIEK